VKVALHAGQLVQTVPGGVGRYVRALLQSLPSVADVAPVAFAAGPPPADVAGHVPWVDVGPPVGTVRYELWHRLRRLPVPVGCDVLHAPSAAIPPAGNRPLVVTVHDVGFLRFPEVSTRHGRQFHRRSLEITRREAAAIITPSDFTRAELVREGIDASRVHAIPHGADRVVAPTAEEIEWQLAGTGLEGRFVLTVGTVEPRKNLPVLVEAMAAVRRTDPDVVLAIAGADGWGRVEGLDRPGVVRLGAVSNRQLEALYRRAELCCQPAIYEGFGLPALEAMTRSCPVVASAGGALEEVVGDAGVLVSPHDPAAIADAIVAVLGDAARRDDLAARGRVRAEQFSWNACAEAHASVYRSLA
jgi:glycosyltransferase involved in cell wall biosynthesis